MCHSPCYYGVLSIFLPCLFLILYFPYSSLNLRLTLHFPILSLSLYHTFPPLSPLPYCPITSLSPPPPTSPTPIPPPPPLLHLLVVEAVKKQHQHSGHAVEDCEDAIEGKVLLVLGEYPDQHVGEDEGHDDQVGALRELGARPLVLVNAWERDEKERT